jgi:iron complex outermembrane receptor protein
MLVFSRRFIFLLRTGAWFIILIVIYFIGGKGESIRLLKYKPLLALLLTVLWLMPLSSMGEEGETATGAAAASEPLGSSAAVKDQVFDNEFELLQLEPTIESASKRSESVFDSPFSADVITRDMIQKAGARTIAEALRLLPGMIVYETTTGNFDVHIRGFDNSQPGSILPDLVSSTMLIMIDYRVVYNYLLGGTYWGSLPIDIIDVERIELVRGPVAGLYGPNAVTGVINIITRKPTSNGLYANAQAQGAVSSHDPQWKNDFTLGQRSVSARIGYKYNSLSGGASANYQSYDRFDDRLYCYLSGKQVAAKDLVNYLTHRVIGETDANDAHLTYPEPWLGYRAVASTAFVAYEPTDKLSFVLNGGYQETRSLNQYLNSLYSPLNTYDIESWYLDLRSRFYDFTFQASFVAGHELLPGNKSELLDGTTRERYDYTFNTLDLILDYDFVWEWLRVRPGVSYRRAQYSGVPFSTWDGDNELEDSKAISSVAVSVALEQAPWKRLRFNEAVRLDVYFDRTEKRYYPFNQTDPITKHGRLVYPSYQFAITYTPADDHILRVTYGHASRSPSLLDSFFNGPPNPNYLNGQIRGNNALNLLTFDTLELGYRTRFTPQTDMSIEVFGTYAHDFSNLYLHTIVPSIILEYDNLNLKEWQVGATVSVGFTVARVQGRVFATVQHTRLEGLAPDISNALLVFNTSYNPQDPKNQKNTNHEATPDLFGGFYLNIQPLDKLNLNVNGYYLSRRTQINTEIPTQNPSEPSISGRIDIQQSFLLNTKVSYNFWNGLTAFINMRNLFNINKPEFAWGDPNHFLCFIGLQYDL